MRASRQIRTAYLTKRAGEPKATTPPPRRRGVVSQRFSTAAMRGSLAAISCDARPDSGSASPGSRAASRSAPPPRAPVAAHVFGGRSSLVAGWNSTASEVWPRRKSPSTSTGFRHVSARWKASRPGRRLLHGNAGRPRCGGNPRARAARRLGSSRLPAHHVDDDARQLRVRHLGEALLHEADALPGRRDHRADTAAAAPQTMLIASISLSRSHTPPTCGMRGTCTRGSRSRA